MNPIRAWIAVFLISPIVVGCQAVAPGGADKLAAASGSTDEGSAYRDEDSFSGRLATTSRKMADEVAKPFDPEQRELSRQQAQLKKRQKQQAAAAKKRQQQQARSPVMAWLFPEPKKPRTLSEWLSQDRPES